MINMTTIEIKKVARSPQFRIAFILVSLVGVFNVVMTLVRYLRILPTMQANLADPLYAGGNLYAVFGIDLYNQVLTAPFQSIDSLVAMYLLPILICFGCGWSMAVDIKNGHRQMLIVRAGKRRYYGSKFLSMFMVGGALQLIPFLISVVILPLFLPIRTPALNNDLMHGIWTGDVYASIYFSAPFLYLVIKFVTNFIYAGLLTCLSGAFSLIYKKRYATVISIVLPFMLLLISNYVLQTLEIIHWSPLNFVTVGNFTEHQQLVQPISIGVVSILAIGLVVYVQGVKRDVL